MTRYTLMLTLLVAPIAGMQRHPNNPNHEPPLSTTSFELAATHHAIENAPTYCIACGAALLTAASCCERIHPASGSVCCFLGILCLLKKARFI